MDRAGLQELITAGEDLYVWSTPRTFRDPDADPPAIESQLIKVRIVVCT